ncbi:hypothetical protein [Aquimarina algiphila]|uniref:hypothetical protein n=1 Tax=Aquimarina algiphila TaxID=2047982 RepID=UPI002330921A|nr:hypothetical protein [Aquimarina algiphila]
MRKLLLFICVISFLTVGSCSKEEESSEVSLTEKEYLVKQTIIEFKKSAIKTGKLNVFIRSISINQKSVEEPLSETELETMVQSFLGDQTQAFLDLYYQLIELNITGDEFRSISYQFEYLRGIQTSSKSSCCGASTGNEIVDVLASFFCGCEKE